MMQTVKKRSYLSLVPDERRQWQRRKTNFLVRLFFTKRGLKEHVSIQARVVDLSEGGAAIDSRQHELVPQQFYVALGNMEIMIGCVCVKKKDGRMHVRFVRPLPTVLVNRLAALKLPLALLQPIYGSANIILLRYASDWVVKHRVNKMRACAAASAGE